MANYYYLNYEKAFEFCKQYFMSIGVSEEGSTTIADVLTASDLMGIESHGLQRMIMYHGGVKSGRIKPTAQPTVERETPVSAVINANDGFGHIVGKMAMQMAIDKAKTNGIGMTVVNNSTHYGIAGYYSMMAARQGMLGFSMTNTEALVVPTFGKTAMIGTNPIAVTMPAEPYPLHIDMATSTVPAGKIEVYNKLGKSCPEGWILNAEGKVTTIPQEFIDIRANKTDGGLLPLGGAGELLSGHKGYALGVLVELMTAILSGGNTSYYVRRQRTVEKCCHWFMAVDYGIFGDKKEIEAHMSRFMQELRDSHKADGQDRIYTHGERELSNFDNIKANGLKTSEKTYEELLLIAEEAGLDSSLIVR